MEFDKLITHTIDMYMGKPKSGKTLIAGSYPKPLLYISVGDDGGGRVLVGKYRKDVEAGLIKVKNLANDPLSSEAFAKTPKPKASFEKLALILKDLRTEGCEFKTIVIDTVGALQDDYKAYLEAKKGGVALTQSEWGEVANKMLAAKDNMKKFSEQTGVTFVWICHTKEMELYETSGLNKEIRIIPDLTINTGVKYMKDASNIFYCCRKTVIENGKKTTKFLTFVGPHPLMDTGTRDMLLTAGDFVDNFTYDKWQQMIVTGALDAVELAEFEKLTEEEVINQEE